MALMRFWLNEEPRQDSRSRKGNSEKVIEQSKELYKKSYDNQTQQEKVDVNGIKVSKKLLNRESLRCCPICGSFPKKSLDDVCLTKFDCCSKCHLQYVEGREERWLKGWRPKTQKEEK
jgi:hypothetical protein